MVSPGASPTRGTPPPLDLRALASAVRLARDTAGLSRAELALRSGVGVGRLAALEQADDGFTLGELHAVAHALGIALQTLLAAAEAGRGESSDIG